MKRILPLLLVFFLSGFALKAQKDAWVSGRVTDSTGVPIYEARIRIAGANTGTVADADGNYKLSVPSGRSLQIEFSFIGLKTRKVSVPALVAGENYALDVQLGTYELRTVVISTRPDRRLMEKVNPRHFEAIPNTGGGIETIIKTLAGVSSNNELSSQYSVRGGNYDENLVYINGIEIYRPMLARSGQEEGLSIIHTDLVEGLQFSAGGFEARYGDKMSSVLDIQYKEPDSFAAKTSLSLLGASASLEGSSKNHRFTYLFGGRYRTNQYLISSLDVKGQYRPAFTDIQSFFTWDVSDKLELGMLTYFGKNRYLSVPESQETTFGTVNEAIRFKVSFDGQEILQYRTLLNGLTANYKINDSNRISLITSAYNTVETEDFDIIGVYKLQQLETDMGSDDFGDVNYTFGDGGYLNHGRNKINSLIYNAELKGEHSRGRQMDLLWGAKYQREWIQDKLSEYQYIDSVDYSVPQDTDNILNLYEYIYSRNDQKWSRYMGYVQNTWMLSDAYNAYLTTGVRGNYWDYNNQLLISPRVQFAFEPNARYNSEMFKRTQNDSLFKRRIKVKLSAGAYHQPPFYRELRSLSGQLNPDIRAQRSYHIVAGTDYEFKMWERPFKWTTEVYYKALRDIIPYEIDNVRIRYYAQNNAKGYATGIDFQLNGELVKDNPSWVSLSIMKTMEDIENDSFIVINSKTQEARTVRPGYIPRPTDQRVRFAMFFQDYLRNNPSYKVHLQMVFGSGLPFGPPDFNRGKDTLRIAPYRRVDIGFSRMLYDRNKHTAPPRSLRYFRSLWISAEVFNLFQINNTVAYLWVKDISGANYAIPRYLTGRRLNLHLEIKF